MAVYRRPTRARYVLAVLVLASITLVTLDSRGSSVLTKVRADARSVLDPITNATHRALAPIGNFLTGAADYGSLEKENDRLRQQLAGLQSNASVAAAAEAEAAAIIKLADLPFATNIGTVDAQVVGEAPENFDVSLQIDKGSDRGVAMGDPVVTQAGLVGTVVHVEADYSTVRVLTDPSFAVGVALPGQDGLAASGEGPNNPLQVDSVESSTPVTKGEILDTSGVSLETFPPGIPVGKVTAVSPDAGALEQTVSLAPLINPAQLLVVAVLTYSGQTP